MGAKCLWAVYAALIQLFKSILCFGNEAPQFGLYPGIDSKSKDGSQPHDITAQPRLLILDDITGHRTQASAYLERRYIKAPDVCRAYIYRQEVRPFSDKQVELVTNFAAQAVIVLAFPVAD